MAKPSPAKRKPVKRSQLFLGGISAEDGPQSPLPAAFARLVDACSETLTNYHDGTVSPEDTARRLQMLRIVDALGGEWTLGASSLRWFRRTDGMPWSAHPSPTEAVKVVDVPAEFADANRTPGAAQGIGSVPGHDVVAPGAATLGTVDVLGTPIGSDEDATESRDVHEHDISGIGGTDQGGDAGTMPYDVNHAGSDNAPWDGPAWDTDGVTTGEALTEDALTVNVDTSADTSTSWTRLDDAGTFDEELEALLTQAELLTDPDSVGHGILSGGLVAGPETVTPETPAGIPSVAERTSAVDTADIGELTDFAFDADALGGTEEHEQVSSVDAFGRPIVPGDHQHDLAATEAGVEEHQAGGDVDAPDDVTSITSITSITDGVPSADEPDVVADDDLMRKLLGDW
jgi:hypothetical protein